MNAEALRTQMAALKRQQRQARRDAAATRVRSIHRQWWWAGAAIVALSVSAVGCQRWQQQQADTTMALAQIATADRTPPTTAPVPVVVQGVPNALDSLGQPLTAQARWIVGVDADGKLLPTRSATVIASMLSQLDLCSVFVGIDDKAYIAVSKTPRPGFVPLVTCAAASTTTAAPKVGA